MSHIMWLQVSCDIPYCPFVLDLSMHPHRSPSLSCSLHRKGQIIILVTYMQVFMDLDDQPCLEHIGFIHNWSSLNKCKEGYACAAIYSRMQDWDYIQVESVTSMTHDSEMVSRLLLCWKNLQEIKTYSPSYCHLPDYSVPIVFSPLLHWISWQMLWQPVSYIIFVCK